MGQGSNATYQATRSLAFGSGEEDFWKIFTIYGRGGHLGHVTQTPLTNFRSPIPLWLHMKFGFDWPSGFGEEDLWKWWTLDDDEQRRRTDDGPWLHYKLTNEPKGSGELKIVLVRNVPLPGYAMFRYPGRLLPRFAKDIKQFFVIIRYKECQKN